MNKKAKSIQDIEEEHNKRLEDKQAEIGVLKEMLKGVKLQLKSKDTDIQRLMLKLKRLETTNELRDKVISESRTHLKENKVYSFLPKIKSSLSSN